MLRVLVFVLSISTACLPVVADTLKADLQSACCRWREIVVETKLDRAKIAILAESVSCDRIVCVTRWYGGAHAYELYHPLLPSDGAIPALDRARKKLKSVDPGIAELMTIAGRSGLRSRLDSRVEVQARSVSTPFELQVGSVKMRILQLWPGPVFAGHMSVRVYGEVKAVPTIQVAEQLHEELRNVIGDLPTVMLIRPDTDFQNEEGYPVFYPFDDNDSKRLDVPNIRCDSMRGCFAQR